MPLVRHLFKFYFSITSEVTKHKYSDFSGNRTRTTMIRKAGQVIRMTADEIQIKNITCRELRIPPTTKSTASIRPPSFSFTPRLRSWVAI